MDDHFKTSFAPLADKNIRVLILGSMPGDMSIAMQEYYGHPRNQFWKIMVALTGSELPTGYAAKKQLLLSNGIGLWDVVQSANRKGSLDSNIKGEKPNELAALISRSKNLEAIAFNGKKSEALVNRHFGRLPGMVYISLPSTSPAHAGLSFEKKLEVWKQLKEYLIG